VLCEGDGREKLEGVVTKATLAAPDSGDECYVQNDVNRLPYVILRLINGMMNSDLIDGFGCPLEERHIKST
jgi:hypothetical protein